MPRHLGLAVGLVALSLTTLPAASQDRPQEPFRGGVTSVAVDVYPRRDGRLVEGLTADDFQVFEDGKPQAVESFEFIRAEPNTPDADRRDPNTQEEGDELAADPHNRVFVVYFDIFHTTFEGAHQARGPLLEFITRTIGATDLFSVLTPEMPPNQMVFGRRIDTLERELTKYFDWGLRGNLISPVGRPPMEAELQSCMSGRATLLGDLLVALSREDLMMTNLEELMVRLGGLRDGRKSMLFISEGWIPQPLSTQLGDLASGSIPVIGSGPGGGLTFDPRRTTTGRGNTWCDQQTVRLASIDFSQRFRDLLARANRANVSFYTVDVGGLRTGLPPLQSRRSGALIRRQGAAESDNAAADKAIDAVLVKLEAPSVTTLQVLAENTDGRAIINTNNLNAGIRQIADDLSAYYLLGYSSTNPTLDGKYRRIEVKVKRPGVSVAARRGYLAMSAASAGPAAAAKAVPNVVADELGRLARLRLESEFFSYAVKRTSGLDVVVELGGAELARGRWSSGADVQATIARSGGEPIAGTARIDPGARGTLVHVALPDGASGPWRVNLRVSDAADVLTDQLDVAAASSASALVGPPLIFRGTSSSRIPLRPVADFLFRRNERVRVQWPLTGPLDARAARLLDRRGEPLALPVAVAEADGVLNVDLNLAPLGEGDYLIELTAGQGAASERRVVAFRIVR